jgi:hypothetical protein
MDSFHQITVNMWKRSVKKNTPLVAKKNENGSDVVKEDEQNEGGNGGVEAHKEKSLLTNDNFTSPDQQHKEKISSTTENNDNLSNDSSRTDSEPKQVEIKFTPDYEGGKPIFWRVFEEVKENNGLVHYDKLH